MAVAQWWKKECGGAQNYLAGAKQSKYKNPFRKHKSLPATFMSTFLMIIIGLLIWNILVQEPSSLSYRLLLCSLPQDSGLFLTLWLLKHSLWRQAEVRGLTKLYMFMRFGFKFQQASVRHWYDCLRKRQDIPRVSSRGPSTAPDYDLIELSCKFSVRLNRYISKISNHREIQDVSSGTELNRAA